MKLRNAAPALVALLFALLFAPNASAQYRPNVVIWDEAPECGEKKTVSEQANYACSAEDGNVRIIETDEIKLKIQPHPLPEKISIRTIIENKKDRAIKTSHKEWSIAHYASEEDFLSRKPPIRNERYLPIPTLRPAFGDGPSPNAGDPTIRVTKTAGSTSSPGYPAQIPAGQQQVVAGPPTDSRNRPTLKDPFAKQQTALDGAFNTMKLAEGTIKKRGSVNGAVVFNTYENAKFKLLIIHIGDTSFVFALRD